VEAESDRRLPSLQGFVPEGQIKPGILLDKMQGRALGQDKRKGVFCEKAARIPQKHEGSPQAETAGRNQVGPGKHCRGQSAGKIRSGFFTAFEKYHEKERNA
jgi:hypothetical protein